MRKVKTTSPAGTVYIAEYSTKNIHKLGGGDSVRVHGTNDKGTPVVAHIMSRNAAWALCMALYELLGQAGGECKVEILSEE